MKRTFGKLIALLLVLILILAGCNLVKVDPLAEIQKQREEVEKDYATVLAEYDGGTVTKFEATGPFYANYTYMSQLYSTFGIEMTADVVNTMIEETIVAEVADYAITQEFDNRGLTLPKTEEEIRAEAEETYDASLESYFDYVDGETEEVKTANAEFVLYSEGLTVDRLYELMLAQYKTDAVQAAVEAEITEVTDEQLQAAYEAKLAEDEATYTENPTQFENDILDESAAVCWIPEGYRTVKHILVIPEETSLQAVADARTAVDTAEAELETLQTELDEVNDNEPEEGETFRAVEEIQADIDAKTAQIAELEAAVAEAETACIATVQTDIDQIYEKLAEGRSFDAVMEVFGEDPGMQSEPNKSTGYYVCADSVIWDPDFTAGAMTLANIGDYSSEPVITTSGIHVVYYNADAVSGPIAIEEVRDVLCEQKLAELKAEHFDTSVNAWVEALNPVYHFDAWVVE